MGILADRVKETTTSNGTGNLSLGGAAVGFRSCYAAFGTGVAFYYAISVMGGADWEVGEGQLSDATTLVRTTVLASSNAGNLVDFTSGTKDVFCTLPAGQVMLKGGTFTTGTWSAAFGAVSGANLTSLTAGNLTGTIPSAVLGNSSVYLGTTAVALNRGTGALSLAGVSIDGSSGSCTGNAATVTNGIYTTTIASYAPSLTGTGATGSWGISVTGSAASCTGNAATATNVAASGLTGTTLASNVVTSSLTTVGTVTTGTWSGAFGAVSGANLTSLTAGNLSGTIPSLVLGNSTHYIGTTAIALNRATASQSLTGITSIDGVATGGTGTNAVTLGMMAQVATQTFLGRTTAATGNVEALTVAQAKTLLGLTGTNSGDQTITLTGDVTGSGTGSFAATIASGVVTLAKMANMATASFIGRNTAATGVPEVLSVATVQSMLGLGSMAYAATSSYAPIGGAGTSGTWGISITGSSASCTGNAATATALTGHSAGYAYADGGTASAITGQANSATITATTSSTASTIPLRDANGYLSNSYFYNASGGAERNASAMGYFSGHNTTDYYIRSYTAAAAAALLSGQTMNINGSSTSCSGNAASATYATYLSNSSKSMVVETAYGWQSFAARSSAATDANFSLQRSDGTGLGGIYADGTSIGFLTSAGSWVAAWNKSTGAMSSGSVPYSLLSGTVPTWNQNTSGSAASVPASGVTGATLASNVTASSLTSVGTLANLTVGQNIYVNTTDRGYGLVGVYDPNKYQALFAMGTSYQLPTAGGTLGSLYGLAWTYDNSGYNLATGYNLQHGVALANAGVLKTYIGVGIYTVGIIRSDSNISAAGTVTGSNLSGTNTGDQTNISGNAATATNVAASGITGQTGMWTSAARPGPYRLYRNDSDSAYNVQTTWSSDVSGYWSLRGYNADTYHAGCYVALAGAISGQANSATTTAATAATGSTIALRDASGHLTNNYNFSSYNNTSDDTSSTGITYIMAKFGDNYHRSASASKVLSFLSLPTAYTLPSGVGTNTYVLTTNGAGSTSWAAPSGGTPDALTMAFIRSRYN